MIRLWQATSEWLRQGGTGHSLPDAKTVVIVDQDGNTLHSNGQPLLFAHAGDEPTRGDRVRAAVDHPVFYAYRGSFVSSAVLDSSPTRVRLVSWVLADLVGEVAR